jgi:uncharacterized protein (DUF2336 family)
MLVKAYLEWMAAASVTDRVEAVAVMAETVLTGRLSQQDREDAEAALMMALDDDALVVRRALAEALSSSERAPRTLILPLAHDLSSIAAHVLLKSPVLSDADLVDLVGSSDAIAQTAIALRPVVSETVSAALATHGALDAAIAVIANDGAAFTPRSLYDIAMRHRASAELRGVMLEREDLPLSVRQILVSSTAEALSGFVIEAGWMTKTRADRCISEAERSASIAIAAIAERAEVIELADTLRREGRLTPNLLLRAVLCGETELLAASLSLLTRIAHGKVAAMIADAGGSAFGAAYDRAGLPASLKAAFVAALRAAKRLRPIERSQLDLAIIRETLIAVSQAKHGADAPVLALLRRYEAEAMRDHARSITQEILASQPSIHAEATLLIEALGPIEADRGAAIAPPADNDLITIEADERIARAA